MQARNVFKNSIVPKVYYCCFLLRSAQEARGKAKDEQFTVVKYESKALDIFILLHIMVNRCEKPEIHDVAKSQLNSSVGY